MRDGMHSSPVKAGRHPNLLLILVDQWRASAFSHGTDPDVRTPRLDQFAKEGVLCTRAYANYPVCTPNRASLLTGRYAHQHRCTATELMLPPGEPSLAQSLREAGYATCYVGKWHLDGRGQPGFVPPGWRRHGFERFEGFNRGHDYFDSVMFGDDGSPLPLPGFAPAAQAARALDFIHNQPEDRPWFCQLAWGPPHTPYKPPADFDCYDPAALTLRPNVPGAMRENLVLRRELAGYYGLCSALDHEFGRLIDALAALGLDRNTLVVFTSDHGDMHGSHGLVRKNAPFEESLRIPLLLRWPEMLPSGRRIASPFGTVDLMPTLLSLCGAAPASACSGRDRTVVIRGDESGADDWVYAQGCMPRPAHSPGNVPKYAEWRAVIQKGHKLIYTAKRATGLYDLDRDPYELHNLVEDGGYGGMRSRLRKLGETLARQTGDPFPGAVTAAKEHYTDQEAAAAPAPRPL